jgi:hypothetical protein
VQKDKGWTSGRKTGKIRGLKHKEKDISVRVFELREGIYVKQENTGVLLQNVWRKVVLTGTLPY